MTSEVATRATRDHGAGQPGRLRGRLTARLRLNQWRIRTRIFAGFTSLIAIACVIVAAGVWELAAVGRQVDQLSRAMDNAGQSEQLSQLGEVMRRAALTYKTSGDDAAIALFTDAATTSADLLDNFGRGAASAKFSGMANTMATRLELLRRDFGRLVAMGIQIKAGRARLFGDGEEMTGSTDYLTDLIRESDDAALAARGVDLGLAIQQVQITNWRFLATIDPKGLIRFRASVKAASEALNEVEQATAGGRLAPAAAPVRKALQAYADNAATVFATMLAADKLFSDAIMAPLILFENQQNEIRQSLAVEVGAARAASRTAIGAGTTAQAALGAACVVLCLSLAALVGHSIAAPVTAMTAAMARLAHGDTAVDIPAQDARDEIGDMAEAMRVFQQNMILAARLAVKARAEQDQKDWLAKHDPLTGLPNRTLFKENLDEVLAELGRGRPFALLCMDLDKFKAVNDTMGHGAGDLLLRQVAERMRACLRTTDSIARLGGDEFSMIVRSPTDVGMIARRVIDNVSRPYDLDGYFAEIGVTIGIASAPEDGQTADGLMTRADLALYAAKNAKRGTYRFFDPEIREAAEAGRELEGELREALQNDELEIHYQPIVSLENQRVAGLEALVRWRHPRRGLLGPDTFIALAEDRGLIAPLGRWVLRRACAQAASWPAPVCVAVNVSPVQLRGEGLLEDVRQALSESGLSPRRLEIEITESAVLSASAATMKALTTLRELGVQIAFDDFGTGFSSLSSLHRYPIDRIKIDRSFVADLGAKPSAAVIVRAMIDLGGGLGLAITGEGVETPEQLAELRRLGCTHAQGYLFSKPRPNADVPCLLRGLSEPDAA